MAEFGLTQARKSRVDAFLTVIIFIAISKTLVRGVVYNDVESAQFQLSKFLGWLEKLPCDKICLVAHNCYKYDAPVLTNQLSRVDQMARFLKIVDFFGDTYVSLKTKFPKKKLKLTVLGAEIISNWHLYAKNAHSALFDVWVMIKVFKHFNLNFATEEMQPVKAVILASGNSNAQERVLPNF